MMRVGLDASRTLLGKPALRQALIDSAAPSGLRERAG